MTVASIQTETEETVMQTYAYCLFAPTSKNGPLRWVELAAKVGMNELAGHYVHYYLDFIRTVDGSPVKEGVLLTHSRVNRLALDDFWNFDEHYFARFARALERRVRSPYFFPLLRSIQTMHDEPRPVSVVMRFMREHGLFALLKYVWYQYLTNYLHLKPNNRAKLLTCLRCFPTQCVDTVGDFSQFSRPNRFWSDTRLECFSSILFGLNFVLAHLATVELLSCRGTPPAEEMAELIQSKHGATGKQRTILKRVHRFGNLRDSNHQTEARFVRITFAQPPFQIRRVVDKSGKTSVDNYPARLPVTVTSCGGGELIQLFRTGANGRPFSDYIELDVCESDGILMAIETVPFHTATAIVESRDEDISTVPASFVSWVKGHRLDEFRPEWLNAVDATGRTAMHACIVTDKPEMAHKLVEWPGVMGSDPAHMGSPNRNDAPDVWSVLFATIHNSWTRESPKSPDSVPTNRRLWLSFVENFSRRIGMNSRTQTRKRTPLMRLIASDLPNRCPNWSKSLLNVAFRLGANMEAADSDGKNLIHYFVRFNRQDLFTEYVLNAAPIRGLIERSLQTVAESGDTVFHTCIQYSRTWFLKRFLTPAMVPYAERADKFGETPLEKSIHHSKWRAALSLLRGGVKVSKIAVSRFLDKVEVARSRRGGTSPPSHGTPLSAIHENGRGFEPQGPASPSFWKKSGACEWTFERMLTGVSIDPEWTYKRSGKVLLFELMAMREGTLLCVYADAFPRREMYDDATGRSRIPIEWIILEKRWDVARRLIAGNHRLIPDGDRPSLLSELTPNTKSDFETNANPNPQALAFLLAAYASEIRRIRGTAHNLEYAKQLEDDLEATHNSMVG